MKTRSNIPPPPKSVRPKAAEPLVDSVPPVESEPPERMVIHDKYRMIEKIGSGGMGDVYKAQVTRDDEKTGLAKGDMVAVKIINQPNGGNGDAEGRFMLEAEAAMKIEHENVIEIYQIGKVGKRIFLVMEYLEGKDVKGLICEKEKRGEIFGWSEVRPIISEVCAALHAAHGQNIIHRDLKPENIFLAENGKRKVKVLDFGYAKFIDGERNVTVGDLKVGTPSYVAPEQIFSENYDHRADLYSFGICIYEMITGRPPFLCDKTDPQWIFKMLTKHKDERPRRPSEALPGLDMPKEAEDALMKALAKDPKDRFQDALEMRDALIGRESKKAMPALPDRDSRRAIPVPPERESKRAMPTPSQRALPVSPQADSGEKQILDILDTPEEESVPEKEIPFPKMPSAVQKKANDVEKPGGWNGLKGAIVGGLVTGILVLGYYNREKIERFVRSLDQEHQVAPSSPSTSTLPTQAPTTFELSVVTVAGNDEIRGASVYDVTGRARPGPGNYLGSTPLRVFVPNGERTILIVKRGYGQARAVVSPSSPTHSISLSRPRPRTEAPQPSAGDAQPEERVEIIEEPRE